MPCSSTLGDRRGWHRRSCPGSSCPLSEIVSFPMPECCDMLPSVKWWKQYLVGFFSVFLPRNDEELVSSC